MNKWLVGIGSVFVLLLAVFFWQVRQAAHQSLDGVLDPSVLVTINGMAEYELNRMQASQAESSELPFYMTLSEQQLINKSALEVQSSAAETVNETIGTVPRARIDVKEQLATFGESTYAFVESSNGADTSETSATSAVTYTFADAENVEISDENLTLLVRDARQKYDKRNEGLWKTAWLAMGLYVIACALGLVVLYNVKTISHWLVNLFIRDATPGPMVKWLIGAFALGLLAFGLGQLYLAYSSIV